MTQPINPDLQVQGQLSDNERLKKRQPFITWHYQQRFKRRNHRRL